MNVFDFDKTIYKKDSSISFFFFCLSKRPVLIFHLFYMAILLVFNKIKWIDTKTYKEKFFSFLKKFNNIDDLLEEFWQKETKNINSWYMDIKKNDDVICSASPQFLVEKCMNKINEYAIVIGTNMNKHTGKISGQNCKGQEKAKLLKEIFGFNDREVPFENAYTDSLSDFPILDLAKNKYLVCKSTFSKKSGGDTPYKFGEQKLSFFQKIKYLIKLSRIEHYVKNGLVLIPLFFSKNIFDVKLIVFAIVGFISFCFASSFVYIINDLADAKKDRLHSTKKKRPIASYMVKPVEAIFLAIFFLASAIILNIFALKFNVLSMSLLLFYIVINLLYSFVLKNIAIVDVFTLAVCYILRVLYGGAVCSVSVSVWLYLTVFSAALFMGYGKRRNEIKKEGDSTRKVNKLYNYNFLDKNTYLCLALTLAFYSIWAYFVTIDFQIINKILVLFSVILVYFILMKYSKSIESENNSGNPIEVLLKDKFLIISVLLYLVVIFVALYFPIYFSF